MWMHVDSAIFCRLNRPNLRDQKFLVQAISILIFLGVTLDWEIVSLDFLRGTPLESTDLNVIANGEFAGVDWLQASNTSILYLKS